MVRKIETEERRNCYPSTVCDLLSVKINDDKLYYMGERPVEKDILKRARFATMLVCINNHTVMSFMS
jgi:hypothetical protein